MHLHKMFRIKMTSLVVVIVQSILNLLFMTINALNNFYQLWNVKAKSGQEYTYFFVTNFTSTTKINSISFFLFCLVENKIYSDMGSTLTILYCTVSNINTILSGLSPSMRSTRAVWLAAARSCPTCSVCPTATERMSSRLPVMLTMKGSSFC